MKFCIESKILFPRLLNLEREVTQECNVQLSSSLGDPCRKILLADAALR